jgi:hypothetical protein
MLVNGQNVDIDQKQEFRLTFTGVNITDIGARFDTYSNTVNLPLTLNNRAIFKLIDAPTGNTSMAFEPAQCLAYDDNTLLFKGYCVIIGTDTNVLQAGIFGALKPFMNSLTKVVNDANGIPVKTDLSIRDLNLGYTNLPHSTWVADNVTRSLATGIDTDSPIQWALFDDGTQGQFDWNKTGFVIPVFMLRPWFRMLSILQGIIEVQNYTLIGDLTPLETAVISGGLTHPDKDWVKNGAVSWRFVGGAFTLNQYPSITYFCRMDGTGDYFLPFDGGSDNDSYVYGAGHGSFGDNSYGWAKITLNYNLFATGPNPGAGYGILVMIGVSDPFAGGGGSSGFRPILTIEHFVTDFYDNGGKNQAECFVYITPNSRLNVRIRTNDFGSTTTTDVAIVGQGDNLFGFTVTPLDYLAPGCQITERCLPDITQYDFIKDVANRYGYVISVDDSAQTVTFQALSNLYLRANALDWSDKLGSDNGSQAMGEYRTTFNYGSLAKNNYYRNAGGRGVGLIQSNTFGVELTRDAYTSPLDIGGDNTVQFWGLTSGQSLEFIQNSGINIALDNTAILDSYINIYGGWFFKAIEPRSSTTRTVAPPYASGTLGRGTNSGWESVSIEAIYGITEIPVIANLLISDITGSAWDNNDGNWISVNDISGTTNTYVNTLQTVTFAKQYWGYLIPEYNSILQDALLNPRVDSLLIRLQAPDVNNLDYTQPILINGVYYYLNQVLQYDPITTKLTQVDLLRLP